jgi:hypothetical protein
MPQESSAPAPLGGRLADGGPRYTETPADPLAPDAPIIAEPFNTITAALFIVIVGIWAWRLRGRYARFPFLCCCLPILLAGGIGGTLYHALRNSMFYFLLDVIPISLLGLAAAVYMANRFWGGRWWVFLPAALAFYIGLNGLIFVAMGTVDSHLRINLSYASLAVVVLTPIVLVLIRTRFRHGSWIAAGAIAFVIAWFFRLWDQKAGPYLSMGSHWLWHTFGAISTALVIEYFYKVEAENSQPAEGRGEPNAVRRRLSSPFGMKNLPHEAH